MGVPGNFVSLTHIAMTRVLPTVNRFLGGWKEKANKIPDPELRRQALMSIEAKTFHCEGGGIYTLLAGEHARETMRFIIAYQTISDYLDNLCDRGTSRDPEDFRTLHTALADALTPGARARRLLSLPKREGRRGLPACPRPDLPECPQGPSRLWPDRTLSYGACRLLP